SQVHKLAKTFVPKGAAPEVDQVIRRLLTAMMEVMRVQAARNDLWRITLARQSMFEQEIGTSAGDGEIGSATETATIIYQDLEATVALEILPLVIKLDRYQRRTEASCRRMISEIGQVNTTSPL